MCRKNAATVLLHEKKKNNNKTTTRLYDSIINVRRACVRRDKGCVHAIFLSLSLSRVAVKSALHEKQLNEALGMRLASVVRFFSLSLSPSFACMPRRHVTITHARLCLPVFARGNVAVYTRVERESEDSFRRQRGAVAVRGTLNSLRSRT